MQKQNLYSAGSVSVLPLTEASWRMEQETEGGWSRGAVGKRKSSRGDGAWLATGAVVLTVRHTAAGRRRRRRGGAVVVGWILGGCVGRGGVPLGLLLSPNSPVGAPTSQPLCRCLPHHLLLHLLLRPAWGPQRPPPHDSSEDNLTLALLTLLCAFSTQGYQTNYA